jgi:redox-sensitive bicupin YhaK (pirin superfamily)
MSTKATNERKIAHVFTTTRTIEGAGVNLNRAFPARHTPKLDPFLLLDHFKSSNPRDYERGFPWHPHRGMETITYVLEGDVEHGDSLGNEGVIAPGDVQWMTAGSGIIHQEMPRGDRKGALWGFQLWANLPAASKMMQPRYQEVKAATIPVVRAPGGAEVRLIAGTLEGVTGPVQDIVTRPEYLDVSLPAGKSFERAVEPGHTVFAFVVEGEGWFDAGREKKHGTESVVVFGPGSRVVVKASDTKPVRFLLVSGQPIGEPVAWAGPIVMNTDEELKTAFDELQSGRFVKHRG